MTTAPPIVDARGVSKAYRRGRTDVAALRGVDLTIGPGEIVVIVGPSGGGKSTLLNLIGPVSSSQEVLTVGNESCSYDGESWSHSSGSSQEREILDLAQGQLDIVVTPASPVEIGRGEIAGIPAINYSFTPAGFGAGSGAVTDISLAEYWVSIDGNVLLKYDLVAESRDGPTDDPDTMTFQVEIHMELIDTVGPGTVTLPADCLAAADV